MVIIISIDKWPYIAPYKLHRESKKINVFLSHKGMMPSHSTKTIIIEINVQNQQLVHVVQIVFSGLAIKSLQN